MPEDNNNSNNNFAPSLQFVRLHYREVVALIALLEDCDDLDSEETHALTTLKIMQNTMLAQRQRKQQYLDSYKQDWQA